jgi:hypothetical protein
MVSPVRIRVSPLEKYLQNAEKVKDSGHGARASWQQYGSSRFTFLILRNSSPRRSVGIGYFPARRSGDLFGV